MNRHKEALYAQCAVNPAGVTHSLARHIGKFMQSTEYTGTNSVTADPALRLLAFQIAYLFGVADVGLADYGDLTRICEHKAEAAESVEGVAL